MKKKVTQKSRTTVVAKGRTPIPIDWGEVDEWLEAGCKGTEVASLLGISDDTLYERCSKEKGTTFSIYSAKKKASGEANLKWKQHKVALAGDRGMLIWLGKQRLSQKDNHDMNLQSDMKIGIINYGPNPYPKTWEEEQEEKKAIQSASILKEQVKKRS